MKDGTAAGVFAAIDPVLAVGMIVGATTWMYQRDTDDPPTPAAIEQCVTALLNGATQ